MFFTRIYIYIRLWTTNALWKIDQNENEIGVSYHRVINWLNNSLDEGSDAYMETFIPHAYAYVRHA